MKTLIIAAVAALGIASTAIAGGSVRPEPRPAVIVEPADNGVELSFELTVSDLRSDTDFGDVWSFRAGATVLTYELGPGISTLELFGELGEVRGDEYAVLGAEYAWAVAANRTTVQLAGEVAYVMIDDFDNGFFAVTPSALVSHDLGRGVDLYGEVGYSWDATNDWTRVGGYAEIGLDVEVNEAFSVRGAVIQPFDTADDDAYAEIGLQLNF